MKSVMNHNFGRIPATAIQRSTFDRSHGIKTAFDGGALYPIFVDEVLPSDEFKIDANFLCRLSTPVVPFMDNLFLETHWFFVPSRLIWTNFTKMMGEQVNPRDSIDFVVPQLTAGANGFQIGSLADYFGIPTGVGGLKVNALPFRAMAKIWDDWYRDENLQESVIQSSDDLGDGNGSISWNRLYPRGKRKDYFTSALPWPQKGEGVELPLGSFAPVISRDSVADSSDGNPLLWSKTSDGSLYKGSVGGNSLVGVSDSGSTRGRDLQSTSFVNSTTVKPRNLFADLSEATAATINSLRMAFQVQRLLERDARGGTRYCEILRSHFKTISPDARLQRSEYLGGSSKLINVNQIAQTSATDGTSPQGNLAAFSLTHDVAHIHKSFSEHGYVIGLVNVRADLNYQQGLNRLWSRKTRYDFYWPVLAHLGEQAVLNKEIYADGSSNDDEVFGYQERYAEYRYKPSIITGHMRSTSPKSLDVWHLAQKFDSCPTLSAEFIEDHPPLNRVVAVTDEPKFILDGFIQMKCTRPMPVYSVPGLVDHL